MDPLARIPTVKGKVWTFSGRVANVVDGDTVDVELPVDAGFDVVVTHEARIRIIGINAPEMRTDEGKAAREYVLAAFPVGTEIQADVVRWDEYGGRHDGNVRRRDGIDWATVMLGSGHAVVLKM